MSLDRVDLQGSRLGVVSDTAAGAPVLSLGSGDGSEPTAALRRVFFLGSDPRRTQVMSSSSLGSSAILNNTRLPSLRRATAPTLPSACKWRVVQD